MGVPHPKPEPRVKKDGHEYGCRCKSCIGRRNRTSGLAKQRKVARKLGVKSRYRGQLGNEETWGLDDWAVEVKSGMQVPKAVTNALGQALAGQPIGGALPPLTVWIPADSSEELVVCRLDDFLKVFGDKGPENSAKIRDAARKAKGFLTEIEGLV